jgi:hypothetical protein
MHWQSLLKCFEKIIQDPSNQPSTLILYPHFCKKKRLLQKKVRSSGAERSKNILADGAPDALSHQNMGKALAA